MTIITRIMCGLVLAAFAVAPAAAQRFTMKLSSPSAGDVTAEWMKALKAGVEARAGNRIRIEIHPAGRLGSIPATVEAVALGTIEATIPATGLLAGADPRFQVFDLPGIFDDLAHAQRVLADPEVVKLYSTFGQRNGVEALAVFAHGPSMVVSLKPIRSVADFSGQRLRVIAGTPLHVEAARKLGVSPVVLPPGEVLPALQARSIDGSVAGLGVLTAMKVYDIANVMTAVPGGIVAVGALANSKFLKSLGRELERAVREEAAKATAAVGPWAIDDARAAREVWTKNGGEIVDLPPDEVVKYRDAVVSALPPLLAERATLRADYERLLAVARRVK